MPSPRLRVRFEFDRHFDTSSPALS